MGIIYQPLFLVADELRAGGLRPLKLDHPPLEGPELQAVYPPGATLPLKTRVMIDYLVSCFGPVPPWEAGLQDVVSKA
jgi:DNA-binding transcriptional LysR family regulator